MKALLGRKPGDRSETDPAQASRPFSVDRAGSVLGYRGQRVAAHGDPEARRGRHGDRAVRVQRERRIGDVVREIAALAEMSPGSVKPGRLASATFAARPMPVSSMPPHHTGTPRARHRSWIARAMLRPPTRPTLMLITRQLPSSSAAGVG